MKKQYLRLVSLCLCICMLVTLLPQMARAESEATIYDSDSFFTPVNDTTVVTKEAKPSNVTLNWGNGYGLQIQSTKTGSDANGSSAKLVSGMTGTIGFDYTPIPNVAEDGSATYAFRKLTFRFTDLENGNSFDYIVHNYNKWVGSENEYAITGANDNGLMGYVSYQGNVRAYERTWDSTNNCHSWWLWKNMDSVDGKDLPPYGGFQMGTFIGTTQTACQASFTWDATEKQILVRDTGYDWGNTDVVLADLDDPEAGFAGFSGFDYYSVEIIFDEVQTDCQAGVLIYAVNMPVYVTSEKDGADKLYFTSDHSTNTDTHAPIVMEDSMGEKTYLEDALTGTVKAIDMETGLIETAGGNSNVDLYYKKQGTEDALAVLNAMVVASAEKDVTYEVYAIVTDGNRNTSEPARVSVCGGKKPTVYDSDSFFTPVNDTTVVTKEATPAFTAKVGDYGLQIKSTATGAGANGSSAKLVSGMTGDVTFRYNVIPRKETRTENVEMIETSNYAFRKMTFRFRDLQNPDNYFDYVVHNIGRWGEFNGNAEHGTMSYVVYNGRVRSTNLVSNDSSKGIQKGMINATTPPDGGHTIGRFRGTGQYYSYGWKSDTRKQEFQWDSTNKQILAKYVNYSNYTVGNYVVADLDDPNYDFGDFSGFDYYSVEIIFDNVVEGANAGVLIHDITMPAYDDTITFYQDNSTNTDNHAPIVVADCLGELGTVKSALNGTIQAVDMETGWIEKSASDAAVKLYYKNIADENASLVEMTAGMEEPEQVGVYEVYAAVTDKNGMESAARPVGVCKYSDMISVGSDAIGYATVYAKDGDKLPTGYHGDKYIIGWTLNEEAATVYNSTEKGNYVADYIDTDMLKVLVQDNRDQVVAGEADETGFVNRFVASVNSTKYMSAGFVFSIANENPKANVDGCSTKETTKVYKKLYAGGSLRSYNELYPDGYSQYLFAFTMKEIPNNYYFYVRAFVQLPNGTYVYGAPRQIVDDYNLLYRNTKDVSGADPFVLDNTAQDGYYYMYTTWLHVYKSKNLTDWQNCGQIWEQGSGTYSMSIPAYGGATMNAKDVWAPEVIYDNGTYYLYFSATPDPTGITDSDGNAVSINPVNLLFVAKSTDPVKGFTLIDFSQAGSCGEENVRAETQYLNGYYFEKYMLLDPVWAKAKMDNQTINNGYYQAIDPNPFVDKDGTKYLYFSHTDGSGSTWVSINTLQMTNWLKVNNSASITWGVIGKENTTEGPEMIYHNGKYYMTYSANSAMTVNYQVKQIVSTVAKPYWPGDVVTELKDSEGGVLLSGLAAGSQEILGTGHHCFVTVGDKLYIIYHFKKTSADGWDRAIAVDEVKWITIKDRNRNDLDVMYVNGPTSTVQPAVKSDYTNLAEQSSCSVTASTGVENIEALTDGILSVQKAGSGTFMDYIKETTITGETTFTFSFDSAKEVRAVMVYNSREKDTIFKEIRKIEFLDENGTSLYSVEHVPFDYYTADYVSPGSAATAKVNVKNARSVRVTVQVPVGQSSVGISEIRILGK